MIKGIGIDVFEIERFRSVPDTQEFLNQILTHEELRRKPAGTNVEKFASISFAIKEAAMKALGCGLQHGSLWRNILVTPEFRVQLSGSLEQIAAEKSVSRIHVSFSCSPNYVVAVVLLEGQT